MRKINLLLLIAMLCAIQAHAWKPLIVGHRGCIQGVENTVEAFRNGVDLFHYDGLECDVRVTYDGAYVISHDETTERLGGSLTVATSTLAQLQAETLTQTRRGVTYTGHICTVAEYLDICVEKGVFPVIELKWSTGINNNDMSNFEGLARLIDEKGLTGKAIILTSMRQSQEYVRTHFPELRCQWLCNANWQGKEDWCQRFALDPSISVGNYDAETVRNFHKRGLRVGTWVIDTVTDYEKCAAMGVYMVTTNSLIATELPEIQPVDWDE